MNPISGDIGLHRIALYQWVGVSITMKHLCVQSIFVTPFKNESMYILTKYSYL